MRISDWSSDVCSSDLRAGVLAADRFDPVPQAPERIRRRIAEVDREEDVTGYDDHGAGGNLEAADGEPQHFVRIVEQVAQRSEERRVRKACDSTCRSRWAPYPKKNNKKRYDTNT